MFNSFINRIRQDDSAEEKKCPVSQKEPEKLLVTVTVRHNGSIIHIKAKGVYNTANVTGKQKQ